MILDSKVELDYRVEPTPRLFHMSDAFYRVLMGPVRSGKSVACTNEIWRRGNEQIIDTTGLRRTRIAIVRDTYRQLKSTTIKTWLDWVKVGHFKWGDLVHEIKIDDLDMEVIFCPLERPDQIDNLLSLELTFAWVNEGRNTPKSLIDALGDRVGQFPPKRDGGCTWSGVMIDSNMPDDDEDSWMYQMEALKEFDGEPVDPKYWQFFRQPGGLIEIEGKFYANPKAENIRNLAEGADYYLKRASGKSKDYKRVYYCAQYGFVRDGDPVHPEYVDSIHCIEENVQPIKTAPIVVGLDFGLTPAAAFLQKQPDGQWIWFDELTTEHYSIKEFGENKLGPYINALIANGHQVEINDKVWGDPAGSQEAQTDKSTCFAILNAMGISAKPAPSQDPQLRRESMTAPLSRMINGRPGLVVCPRVKVGRRGLQGGYFMKKVKDNEKAKPSKNKYSHVIEAAEYALLGEGEGKQLITKKSAAKKKKVYRHPQDWMR